jgi:ParB family chromosome partitioning protein
MGRRPAALQNSTRVDRTPVVTTRDLGSNPSDVPRRARRSKSAAEPRVAPSGVAIPELCSIPLEAIQVPRQPVRRLLGDIAALADSMNEYGLQQPISVLAVDGGYRLTSGLRRLTAARMLGWHQILAFVRTVSADRAYLLDLIENMQREDLTPEEEADALSELVRTRGWTLQQVADAVKRSVGYVSRRVRIFEDPVLRAAIVARGLPVSTAEVLLAAEPEQRQRLIERALDEGWDQGHTRVAVQASLRATADALDKHPGDAVETTRHRPVEAAEYAETGDLSRPVGFTRLVREFHRVIMVVRPEDLSAADRSALRALFRDFVLLARSSTTAAPAVFPPLPGGPFRDSRPHG